MVYKELTQNIFSVFAEKTKKPLKNKDFNVTLYIITPIGVDEIRSLSAVWNQHEVLNVINPKENAPAVMPYAFGDYILTCGEITCQSFGLDRKKTVRKRSFSLCLEVKMTTPYFFKFVCKFITTL